MFVIGRCLSKPSQKHISEFGPKTPPPTPPPPRTTVSSATATLHALCAKQICRLVIFISVVGEVIMCGIFDDDILMLIKLLKYIVVFLPYFYV